MWGEEDRVIPGGAQEWLLELLRDKTGLGFKQSKHLNFCIVYTDFNNQVYIKIPHARTRKIVRVKVIYLLIT